MSDPVLHVIKPEGEIDVTVLPDRPITIGRHQRNLLFLDQTEVSRFHAVILRIGPNVHVVDLQSRNRTLINGSAVTFAPLRIGDVLEIGPTRITLSQVSDQLPPKPMPALGPRPVKQPVDPGQVSPQASPAGDYNASSSVAGSGGYSPSPSLQQSLDSGNSHNSTK